MAISPRPYSCLSICAGRCTSSAAISRPIASSSSSSARFSSPRSGSASSARAGARWCAPVDNRAMAQSVGINTSTLFMATFALGSGLAGLGGALGADILPVQWSYPFEHLVYFLIVVAVGGLGSLRGPFIAALLIGIADTACKYWIPEFGAFLIYAATIAILLWRPQGLFGVRT